jgi:hypothetical protein
MLCAVGYSALANGIRGRTVRLHVSDSVYEYPYYSVHDFHTKALGF